MFNGYVCSEHFKDECFALKNKSRLKPDAVPMILEKPLEQPNCSAEVGTNNELGMANMATSPTSPASPSNLARLAPATPATVATTATACSGSSRSQCMECQKKDALIAENETEIKNLKNCLKKLQKKVSYLSTIRRKLDTAFSELKEQSLVDEELCRSLEVCNICNLLKPLR